MVSSQLHGAYVLSSQEFVYEPPPQAIAAQRILVKPNLGYPVGPPVTVSMAVLGAVVDSLRRYNPRAEILIVEGVCSAIPMTEVARRNGLYDLLGPNIQVLDAETLPLAEYPNRFPYPVRFESLLAPALLREVDCRISVSAFKKTHLKGEPLISAALKNLYGLFPRRHYQARSPKSRGQLHRPSVPLVLQDIYGCVGHLFNGAVVDATLRYISSDWQPDRVNAGIPLGKVIWGNDLLAVDRKACETSGEGIPSYISALEGSLNPT